MAANHRNFLASRSSWAYRSVPTTDYCRTLGSRAEYVPVVKVVIALLDDSFECYLAMPDVDCQSIRHALHLIRHNVLYLESIPGYPARIDSNLIPSAVKEESRRRGRQ